MDRLTPAQQAVLERIERKKELEAKKLLKRKGKKAPTTATSVKPDEKPSQQGQGDAEIVSMFACFGERLSYVKIAWS